MQVTGMRQQYLSLRAQLLKGDSDLYRYPEPQKVMLCLPLLEEHAKAERQW